MAYASGKHAYGICDLTGFRYKLKDMKKTSQMGYKKLMFRVNPSAVYWGGRSD